MYDASWRRLVLEEIWGIPNSLIPIGLSVRLDRTILSLYDMTRPLEQWRRPYAA